MVHSLCKRVPQGISFSGLWAILGQKNPKKNTHTKKNKPKQKKKKPCHQASEYINTSTIHSLKKQYLFCT